VTPGQAAILASMKPGEEYSLGELLQHGTIDDVRVLEREGSIRGQKQWTVDAVVDGVWWSQEHRLFWHRTDGPQPVLRDRKGNPIEKGVQP
jgi:hypothetical protein